MGTVFSFDLRPPHPPEGALERVVGWLHRMDAVFSTYRAGSAVSRLARGEVTAGECAPEVAEILRRCAELTRVTKGCFSAYAGGVLDPSGLVKGWAVERASAMLRAAGCPRHSVGGGGDVQAGRAPEPGRPSRLGIADPVRPGRTAAAVTGEDLAVATSGTAERGTHILDPRTGRPAAGLAAVTVVGPSRTLADAYATAAFVMGDRAREWVEGLPGYEAFAVGADGRVWTTTGLGPPSPSVRGPGDRASGPFPARGRRRVAPRRRVGG